MIDKVRIQMKLVELRKRVKLLEKHFKSLPEEKLILDETLYAAAERHLEVAIQSCMDIGTHIIAQLGLDRPKKENREIFIILAKAQILPLEFARKLATMVGYRNILVHEYTEVERHYTYENIQENLGDFARFAKYIEQFLQEKSKKL